MPLPLVKAFEQYSAKVFTLIPLFRFDATSRTKKGIVRRDGKRPLHFNWTKRLYERARVIALASKGHNVGVRLKASQLVIDVDPRNGGDVGFRNLCADLKLDPSIYPTVITGSGGLHVYMTKPEDVPVVDTLESYPGVEFKSKGRQVLAAGCIHPDTLKPYAFDGFSPTLEDGLPPVPPKLLKFIRRPQRSGVMGGGQYDQEQIARALDRLDATDFADQDKWLRIMMAVHHASGGDARQEFIDWSTSDPHYADDSEIIGRRWDSLHKEKSDGITYRTLNKYLAEAGAGSAQVAPEVEADEFGDVPEEQDDEDDSEITQRIAAGEDPFALGADDGIREEGRSDAALSRLEALNEEYATVRDAGKFKVIYHSYDFALRRRHLGALSPYDFEKMFSNERIENDKTGKSRNASDTVPLGKAWMEWPQRRHYNGVCFEPEHEGEADQLNLFDGFAYEASRTGSWQRLEEMIFEILSESNDDTFKYVLNWLAFLFQHPAERAEVALVFQGPRGVGKGTLGNLIVKLIGRHALSIGSSEAIAGRFNSHLQDCLFLFADEAVKPFDKVAESRLKNLITEPLIASERKGYDIVQVRNYAHIMMATNEKWAISAAIDERRYMVTQANAKWRGRHDLWQKLHDELDKDNFSGGRRFLHDLIERDIEGFHPRQYPITRALIMQKVRTLQPMQQFFFNCVFTAQLPFEIRRGPWEEDRIRFFAEDFRQGFAIWCRENGINPGSNSRSNAYFLEQDIRELFPSAHTRLRDPTPEDWFNASNMREPRARAIEIPSLPQCREDFNRLLGGDCGWTDDEKEFG